MNEKLVSVEDARSALRSIRPTDTHITMRRGDTAAFFHTIIAQDAQIKRLQAALREAEVKRRQVWVEMGANIDPHGAVDWETQYDALTAEDMEDTDE